MENLELIGMYKGYNGGSFLYRDGSKFYVKYTGKDEIKEISVDDAKELFQKMNRKYTFEEVFGS